jgi:uncharacterized membrane protein
MEWYYALDNRQMGPVNEEQFAELVRQGVITPATPVWRMGMAGWLPYGQVTGQWPAGSVPAASAPSGNSGASTRLSPNQWEASLETQDYELKFGECLSEGMELVKRNLPVVVGTSVLVWFVLAIINSIPLLGSFIYAVIAAPAMGGLMCFYLRFVRRQEGRLGDAFCGFGTPFLPVVLASIIRGLINLICLLPFMAAGLFVIFAMGLITLDQVTKLIDLPLVDRAKQMQQIFSHLPITALLILAVGFFVTIVLSTIVSTLLQFSYVLIIDKGMEFIPAMRLSAKRVSKHFVQVFVLILLGSIIAASGALLCLVGLLFTIPLFLATLAVAYEKIFPGQTTEQS